MCIIKINKYFGRNSNNLLQILNNIHNCFLNNYSDIVCPPHELFSKTKKIVNSTGCNCDKVIVNDSELLLKLKLSTLKLFYKYMIYNKVK